MTSSLRVAIYARYSTDMQSAASLEDQIRLCREWTEREGHRVIGTYEDQAVSGATLLRPGVQRLMEDARVGRFDIVVCEALDRLSRGQADVATLYQDFTFQQVSIVTLAEGAINEMHIGLKGTMNQMFLKDLAAKTRRGLRGRVEAGKSGGGNAFGYRVVRAFGVDGEPERGDREIHTGEAAVVRRIFTAYADGMSPNRIADMLNEDGVPGPRGNAWDKSTIHGNPKRGTGILNNALYIGQIVWNRQTFMKDPRSGKRQARPNPEDTWIRKEVPDLRIIDQNLWDRVKARQQTRKLTPTDRAAWQTRRPKFLFSGLLNCGCCGGGMSTVSRDRYGCSNARNKGASYCTSRVTISRADLEGRILQALSEQLMDPELVKVFCAEYVAERNRLQAGQAQNRTSKEQEIKKLIKEQDQLVDALLQGIPATRIKDRMAVLDARQAQLEAELAITPAVDPVRLHPAIAQTYRARVGDLISHISDPDRHNASRDALRALIDKVVITPVSGAGKRPVPHVMLHGTLAGILALSTQTAKALTQNTKAAGEPAAFESVELLVAGVGFEPTTFRL